MTQLALFTEATLAAPQPSASPQAHAGLVLRARQVVRDFQNFAWWCKHGNQEMCAAVLWRRKAMDCADALLAVQVIANSWTEGSAV